MGMLTASLLLALQLAACNCATPTYDASCMDSAYIDQQIDYAINPTFDSLEEILIYQDDLKLSDQQEAVFCMLPREVLVNVATVCLRKYGTVTMSDVATEYMENNSVYDNLMSSPPDQDAEQTQNTTPDANNTQSTSAGGISYRSETDTINGEPVKVIIREERIYEQ